MSILGFLGIILTFGCKSEELDKPKPTPTETEREAVAVISVGMDSDSASAILSRFNLAAVEDDSAVAMPGGEASRRLRVGVNANGDALFLTATTLANGSEEVTDMFWHRNWVFELDKPKSERKDDTTDVDEVNLNDAALKTFIPGERANEIDRDPFGG